MNLPIRLRFPSSKKAKPALSTHVVNNMAHTIESMRDVLQKSTPRLVGLLALALCLPGVLYTNRLIEKDFWDPTYLTDLKRLCEFGLLKNWVNLGWVIGYQLLRYKEVASKYAVPAAVPSKPWLLGLCAVLNLLNYPMTGVLHPMTVLAIAGADAFTFKYELKMAVEGRVPFHLYNVSHYLRSFWWVNLAMASYVCFSRGRHQQAHPHLYP